jgi:isopenicillin-N N-acyltransferase-like protein
VFQRHFMPAICITGLFAVGVPAGQPFRYPEGKHGKAELKCINGLPVLQVEGSPEEIGEAIGVLALRPAQKMTGYPKDLLAHYYLNALWRPILLAGRKMVEAFPPDYRRELEAMAQASRIERDRLVAGNTLFDLKKLLACSALLVEPRRSATGSPLLGRNLDYPSLGYAHEYSLVTVYRPQGAKHAFASIGFPGLVGCLSGMNDAGLALAVLEVFQVRVPKKWFNADGTPYALCYRRLLEECATIAEAKDLLTRMKRTTTTNLVVADRQGIAVFEITPDYVVVRQPRQGTCACTNHFCTDELKPFLPINFFRTLDRYSLLEQAPLCCEKLGLNDVHRSLDAVREEEETLQTMIFEPAGLRVHLAIGTCPASAGKMKVLELAPLYFLRPATSHTSHAPAPGGWTVRGLSCR